MHHMNKSYNAIQILYSWAAFRW